jgi:ribosomal protein L37AE/L43A
MEVLRRASATQCPQCGTAIIAPEWSEHLFDRCVRNVWFCQTCGYQFEHNVYFSAPELQPELKIDENKGLPEFGVCE